MTAETLSSRYEAGLKRYEEGAPLDEVLAEFETMHLEAPNDARILVSLSWLHLMLEHKDQAIAFSKKAKGTAQGRYNLALAQLTFKEKGVRQTLEEAVRLGGHDGLHDAMDNLEDAIKRKGGSYPAAERMLEWLKEMH
jgi:hypothetical protein